MEIHQKLDEVADTNITIIIISIRKITLSTISMFESNMNNLWNDTIGRGIGFAMGTDLGWFDK